MYILVFQLTLLSRLPGYGMKINSFIIHEAQSHNCDTGWVLSHISIVFIPIPFKHSYDGYSIYIGLSCIMTEVCSYFMQIISHNSVIVHHILTSLGTKICFNESLKCAKFQLNRSMHLYFMADFCKMYKKQ